MQVMSYQVVTYDYTRPIRIEKELGTQFILDKQGNREAIVCSYNMNHYNLAGKIQSCVPHGMFVDIKI